MLESPAWSWEKEGPWVFRPAFKAAALPRLRAGAGWKCNRDFPPGHCIQRFPNASLQPLNLDLAAWF